MTQVDSGITSVRLEQGNAFQPHLRVVLDVRYNNYGGSLPDNIELTGLKGKLYVRTQKPDWFELCVVEQDNDSNSVHLGGNTLIHMTGTLSPYLMSKLEELRNGNDLWFRINQPIGWCVPRQNTGNSFETLNIQSRGSEECKYPRSEWIEHLNTTEFNKFELIELPKIEFPKLPLTEHIVKFTDNARRAFSEGRYGDVLKESRNALDALDAGLEEWANSKPELKIENDTKQNGKNDKRRNYLSILLNDKEKASRLSKIIGDLHYYLSLNPHEAEYKGMIFTDYDAKFVIHAVTGFVNSILKHIENNTKI
ncbi:hypothetical protein [Nitrosopumilus sp.]|uniref:hypothetical protein n=1 Tax=Nitrosopumilus sp. TaxID=2024843 RepID=UPI003D1066D5